MRANLKGIGIIALTAVVIMAIVGRWPAARRVIFPQVEPVGMPRRRIIRRPRRIWV